MTCPQSPSTSAPAGASPAACLYAEGVRQHSPGSRPRTLGARSESRRIPRTGYIDSPGFTALARLAARAAHLLMPLASRQCARPPPGDPRAPSYSGAGFPRRGLSVSSRQSSVHRREVDAGSVGREDYRRRFKISSSSVCAVSITRALPRSSASVRLSSHGRPGGGVRSPWPQPNDAALDRAGVGWSNQMVQNRGGRGISSGAAFVNRRADERY